MRNLFIGILICISAYGNDVPKFNEAATFGSVGVLLGQYGSFCNATLISLNYAITNYHCISTERECSETRLGLAINGGDEITHQYSCTDIFRTGPYSDIEDPPTGAGDWTIIKLKGEPGLIHGYVPLVDAKDNSTEMEVWRLKFNLNDFAYLSPVTVKCSSRLKKNRQGLFYHEMRPETNGTPCHIQRGNSGGPIFDSKGRLTGLTSLFTVRDPKTKKLEIAIGDYLNHYDIDYLEYIAGPSIFSILEEETDLLNILQEDQI